MSEIEELRAEIAALRREVEKLKAERVVLDGAGRPRLAFEITPQPVYPGGPWPATCVAGEPLDPIVYTCGNAGAKDAKWTTYRMSEGPPR